MENQGAFAGIAALALLPAPGAIQNNGQRGCANFVSFPTQEGKVGMRGSHLIFNGVIFSSIELKAASAHPFESHPPAPPGLTRVLSWRRRRVKRGYDKQIEWKLAIQPKTNLSWDG